MLGLVAAIARWRPSIPLRYSPVDYCARSIVHNSPSGPWWAADAFPLLASEGPQVKLRFGFLSAGRIELALLFQAVDALASHFKAHGTKK